MKLEDDEKPLSTDILSNPNSAEVEMLLYLYTMEPPFYAELQKQSKLL